jgi:uncharacterized protein YsxB (DUF464 family)
MTNAIFREIPGTDAIEMRVQGHTGFAEQGKDPVCAGASVLAFTAAQCIQVMGNKLQKAPNITIAGGNVRVVAKPRPEYRAEAMHIFYVAEVGFEILSESYPGHITLRSFIQSAQDGE